MSNKNKAHIKVFSFALIVSLTFTLLSGLFYPTVLIKPARAATALTNVSNTLTSTQVSATTTHQVNFTTYTSIPADGKVVITFPSGFDVSSAAYSAWSGFDGGRSVATSGQVVTITRDGAGSESSAGSKYITLSGITNSASAGTTYTVTVQTQNASSTTLDGPTTSFYFSVCTNACHTSTYHIPWSSTISTSGKHTTKFTTADTVPADGKIKLTFPSGFDLSSTTFDSWSGFDGGQSVSINNQTITITRDGAGNDTVPGDMYVILDSITNHATAGTYYVTLETTDASDTNIEGPTSIRFSVSNTGLGLMNSAWPIRRHDLKATGHSSYSGPSYPAIKWVYDVGVVYESSPVVGSDNTLYVDLLDGHVHAVNSNGTLKWELAAGTNFRGTPTLGGDGTIYTNWDYATGKNGSGDRIYAVSSDGAKKWSFSSGSASEGVGLSVVGSDGTIYITSLDKNLYAINPDGTLKWKLDLNEGMWTYVSLGDDGIIYAGSYDSVVYGVNAGGVKVFTSAAVGSLASGVPTIAADGSIYMTNYATQLYALNSDGSVKWSYTNGPTRNFSSVSLADSGVLYFNSYNGKALIALNADGTTRWTYPNPAGTVLTGSPIVGQDGVIYFNANGTNKVYAINSDGSFRWSYNKASPGGNSTPALDSNGILYSVANSGGFTSSDGDGIYALQPWTLTASLNRSDYYNPGDIITFTATSSMLSEDPVSEEANQIQAYHSDGTTTTLTYSSTNSDGNTVWTGTYQVPTGIPNGTYTSTIEAAAVNVETDTTVHFASAPTNTNNTGITASVTYTVKRQSAVAPNLDARPADVSHSDLIVSTPAQTTDPTLPQLSSPSFLETTSNEHPFFRWQKVINPAIPISYYELIVDNQVLIPDIPPIKPHNSTNRTDGHQYIHYTGDSIEVYTKKADQKLTPGTHTWYIRAVDDDGNYHDSPKRALIIDPNASTQEGVTPVPSTTTTEPTTNLQTYTVKPNDCLTTIATQQLNSFKSYQEIINLNKDKYPSLLTDPGYLKIGWQLILPSTEQQTSNSPQIVQTETTSNNPTGGPEPANPSSLEEETLSNLPQSEEPQIKTKVSFLRSLYNTLKEKLLFWKKPPGLSQSR